MTERVRVTIGLQLEERHLEQIRALGSRIELDLPPGLPRLLRDSPDQAQRAALAEALAETEVLFSFGQIGRAGIEFAPRLRWFQVAGAGLDRFVDSGGLELPIVVTNSSGVGAAPIAEWVVGAILLLAKGFHHLVRNQSQHQWKRGQTALLEGKTVGIVGLGAIGEAAAQRLKAFGVRVIATRRSAKPGDTHPGCDLLLPQAELPRLLAESDYVVLAVPLTAETRHLIDGAALARMRPSACLVNVARGAVVDQDALLEALREGRIAGAALDVTDPEPLPAEHPLWDEPNLLISPHMSAIFDGYLDGAIDLFVRNLRHYLAGETLENIVDPKLGY